MPGSLFRYIALGDSTGVGVGAGDDGGYPERLFQRLRKEGVPAGLLNLCRSGATSADLLGPVLERARTRKPHLVTVGVGTNDVWRLVEPAVFGQNLSTVLAALRPTGATLVVCGLADMGLAPAAEAAKSWLGLPPEAITSRVRAFNVELARAAAAHGAKVVELWRYSQQELPTRPDYFCPDGFHPSSAGYARWAELMWPEVSAAATAFLAGADQPRV